MSSIGTFITVTCRSSAKEDSVNDVRNFKMFYFQRHSRFSNRYANILQKIKLLRFISVKTKPVKNNNNGKMYPIIMTKAVVTTITV